MIDRLRQSLSFRLALAYAVLLSVSMGVLAGAYYWIAIAQPLDQIRARVDRESQVLAQAYIVDGTSALIPALERRLSDQSGGRAFHALISADGRLVSGNLPSWPVRPFTGWFSIEADVYRDGGEQDFSALSRDRVFADGTRLIVGRDAENVEDREEALLMALPWVIGLTITFGLTGGLVMSRTIGRRLDAISTAARQIIAGDLGGRVPAGTSGDDFDRLAGTLNLMLARNQELFEAVRRVSDSVAHELRTPLARLTARLEALQGTEPGLDEYASGIEAALVEADRLQAIFNALLRIARIEGGRHEGSWREVDLAALATDASELYAPLAESRSIGLKIDAASGIVARIDPDLMFQALANLLDNALKHTPTGGTVTIGVSNRDNRGMLTLSDTGPGVAEDEIGRMTERFFRGQGSRDLPGEGLGLSLVSAIILLHRGTLAFRNGTTGLQVDISMPLHGT